MKTCMKTFAIDYTIVYYIYIYIFENYKIKNKRSVNDSFFFNRFDNIKIWNMTILKKELLII